ncbi:hypothetical protein CBS101457_006752 [Exobasidium rhododendri]|nr:hypothetical protein CBS101457_006752 [Exobasidium rhododendri]
MTAYWASRRESKEIREKKLESQKSRYYEGLALTAALGTSTMNLIKKELRQSLGTEQLSPHDIKGATEAYAIENGITTREDLEIIKAKRRMKGNRGASSSGAADESDRETLFNTLLQRYQQEHQEHDRATPSSSHTGRKERRKLKGIATPKTKHIEVTPTTGEGAGISQCRGCLATTIQHK